MLQHLNVIKTHIYCYDFNIPSSYLVLETLVGTVNVKFRERNYSRATAGTKKRSFNFNLKTTCRISKTTSQFCVSISG